GTLTNKAAAYVSSTRLDTGYAKVYQYGPPVATLKSKSNVKCKGGTDGSFEVQVTGGMPGFRYSIYGGSPFQYSAKFNNLPAASYVVTVTDSAGQTDTVQITVSEPLLSLSVSTPLSKLSNVDCFGNNTGFIEAVATGGTAAYSYTWNTTPTKTTALASGLKAGTYTVTVTDVNGCTAQKTTTITEPTALTVSATSTTNVNCKGNTTGSVTVAGLGGTTPYTYNIGGGTYASANTFGTLAAGTYTIGVKDANGCTSSVSVTITEPTALTVSATSTTNVDCKGNSTGSVTVTGLGGTTPYTYNIGGGTYATANTFGTLVAGNYTIGVKDANGCTNTVGVTITEPAVLNLSATIAKPVCYNDKTGTITLSATGGTTAYSYRVDSSWSMPTSAYVSTAAFGNYYEGKYAAQVKDANGCLDTVQISIQHQDLIKPVPVPRIHRQLCDCLSFNYQNIL
ncbi:MAG: hypothetical protein EBT66_09355, partial [Bacteroidetes bacterium]|nr:hypothetical protein [Bacteroidota bacterium]